MLFWSKENKTYKDGKQKQCCDWPHASFNNIVFIHKNEKQALDIAQN